MLESVGHAVSRLIRIRYGAMLLPRGLQRGAWMELGDADIQALMRAVKMHDTTPRKATVPVITARPVRKSPQRPPAPKPIARQPDPMKTSVGYIGADSFARLRAEEAETKKRRGRR
jgi:23S rRNA pseudouridine2605 synthase